MLLLSAPIDDHKVALRPIVIDRITKRIPILKFTYSLTGSAVGQKHLCLVSNPG